MIKNQEEDEFVAVRVQDPRVQNEGSWNSYVDYKIFLHTNSKAFTAKTSCVRRRYSEFVWLRKKLQKNAGLVPVPDLPGKSLFSFTNEDFLEKRRTGLQAFLDKVVHMTVCLSDSQLHLFLQTQLPVGHIQDCVQGHTPYTVTDAILTYASSNRGLAQAQEDDFIKEPSLTISYESTESPAPHQPFLHTNDTFSPELLPCGDSDPLDGLLEVCDQGSYEIPHKEHSSVRISEQNNHLEAVVEDFGPTEATFYLGESPEQAQQNNCQIQTPVEVHSPMGTGLEEGYGATGEEEEEEEESVLTIDAEERTVIHPDTQEVVDQRDESEEANGENAEPEKSLSSVVLLDFKDSEEQITENDATRQEQEEEEEGEEVLEDICSEKQALENHITSEVCQVVADGNSDKTESEETGSKEELPLQTEICEAHEENGEPEVINGDCVTFQETHQNEKDLVSEDEEEEEDTHSLQSSNESIVKVSDEESVCEEEEDSSGFTKTCPEDDAHWSQVQNGNVLDLQLNGCATEMEDVSLREDGDLKFTGDISGLSADLNSTLADGENSDFSILEISCAPGLVESKCTQQEAPSSPSLDASEENVEVEVC
ncbi:sorting nexin-11 [Mugil cephalus]|uniref:sorting nexin-11 n=1 Tax=Mugil cephalus TaxID=48193 RepID=UPI001FB6168A|nr:sorting nexin-11 [Mugil cephalus]